jgi:2-hydroxychromene-2-carboxylate isomerase
MSVTIDYYFTAQSPWTYFGHARFAALAKAAGATVNLRPVDYGRIFPASGGLPLAKRAPQRQAYRLVELRRFSEHLKMPLNLQPKFFPVSGDAAARLLIAVDTADGNAAAMDLAGRIMRACWAEERDIADAATLSALLAEAGLPAARLQAAQAAGVQARYAGVFGAPSYVVDGEIFWGQDRLDFLARRLGV